jgi:hypothetical protein
MYLGIMMKFQVLISIMLMIIKGIFEFHGKFPIYIKLPKNSYFMYQGTYMKFQVFDKYVNECDRKFLISWIISHHEISNYMIISCTWIVHIPVHLIPTENVTIPGHTEIDQENSHFRDLLPIPVIGNDIFSSVPLRDGVTFSG